MYVLNLSREGARHPTPALPQALIHNINKTGKHYTNWLILLTIGPTDFSLTVDESKSRNHFLQSLQPITYRFS